MIVVFLVLAGICWAIWTWSGSYMNNPTYPYYNEPPKVKVVKKTKKNDRVRIRVLEQTIVNKDAEIESLRKELQQIKSGAGVCQQ